MPFPDLPPQMQERVVCSISAAIKYEVPANIVLAVAEKEAGKPGQWVANANGTYDVGSLQFNTKYLRDLARYGITVEHVAAAGCYPYDLAAWRLRMHIKNDAGDIWTRAANYHSRTDSFNSIYRADLMRRAARWANWIDARFPTHDVLAGAVQKVHPVRQATATVATFAGSASHQASAPYQPASDYVPRRLLSNSQP